MDPNRVWEDIQFDIDLLREMEKDEMYARRVKWAEGGTTIEDVRGTLFFNLTALASWVKKGGFPPQKA